MPLTDDERQLAYRALSEDGGLTAPSLQHLTSSRHFHVSVVKVCACAGGFAITAGNSNATPALQKSLMPNRFICMSVLVSQPRFSAQP
jgi:hypothetical protein